VGAQRAAGGSGTCKEMKHHGTHVTMPSTSSTCYRISTMLLRWHTLLSEGGARSVLGVPHVFGGDLRELEGYGLRDGLASVWMPNLCCTEHNMHFLQWLLMMSEPWACGSPNICSAAPSWLHHTVAYICLCVYCGCGCLWVSAPVDSNTDMVVLGCACLCC
jgi:hypothetical protein